MGDGDQCGAAVGAVVGVGGREELIQEAEKMNIWRRSNKWGAFAGILCGGAMVFLWKFVIAKMGGVFAIYELLPAFIIGLIVNVLVSLVTGEPSKTVTTKYDQVCR